MLERHPAPMSDRDFAMLGMDRIAYARPVDDGARFAICAANGAPLATVDSGRDVALAVIVQHDLTPFSVH